MSRIRCILLALPLILRAQDHMETQKVILENQFARVTEIRVPPGVFEPLHSHARGVTVALSDYDNETKTMPEGKVSKGHTTTGEVKWAEPVTHEARNTGKGEQHVIRVELKAAVGRKDLPAPDSGVRALFDNSWARTTEGAGRISGAALLIDKASGSVRWVENGASATVPANTVRVEIR